MAVESEGKGFIWFKDDDYLIFLLGTMRLDVSTDDNDETIRKRHEENEKI